MIKLHRHFTETALWIVLAVILFGAAACQTFSPSPKLKAAMADEEIRREVCQALTLDGYDFPGLPYSKDDTEKTKDYAKQINRFLDAYCPVKGA